MVDPVSFKEIVFSKDLSSTHDLDGSFSEFSEEFANFGKREPIS